MRPEAPIVTRVANGCARMRPWRTSSRVSWLNFGIYTGFSRGQADCVQCNGFARLRFLGPDLVGAAWSRLVGGEVPGRDVGVDEVFRWDGAAGEAAQEG